MLASVARHPAPDQPYSQATFTHTICPDCIRKMYPDLADELLSEIKQPGYDAPPAE
jgi:hypothetical protein